MFEPRDAPYPELKKSHTMAHVGRPFTDFKPPAAAPVWAAIEGLARFHVLVAALELDVFDTMQRLGPSTIEQINAELQCSQLHLQTLLDSVVVLGLLDQVNGVYELNDTAKRYLVSDGPATMAALVPVAPGPHDNWTRLADTIRNGRPSTPIEDDPAAFYVPLVEGTFTTMFRCATRADLKIRYSAMRSPRVLDLGAGGAPWAIAVLAANPEATAVVNDLPGVTRKPVIGSLAMAAQASSARSRLVGAVAAPAVAAVAAIGQEPGGEHGEPTGGVEVHREPIGDRRGMECHALVEAGEAGREAAWQG